MTLDTRQHILLSIIGHLGMLGIVVLAYTLWLERGTTFDASLYSYTIILREYFYIPHDRWINYLWQWIPIIGVKSGVSLPVFLTLMSVAPILFIYAIFVLITHGFRNAMAGLYLVLSLLILTRYKFYSAISEIYLSTVFVALMVGWMTMDRGRFHRFSKGTYIFLGVLITGLSYLGHPLIFIPLGVVIFFDFLMLEQWKSWAHIIWAASCSLLFAIKYFSVTSTSYEGNIIDSFQKGLSDKGFLKGTSELYTVEIFCNYVETQWAFPLLVCFLMLLYLIAKRKILAAVWIVIASIFWILFVLHFCGYLQKPVLFMIEGYFGVLSLVILLPMLYINLDKPWLRNIRAGIIICLIIFGLHRISTVRPFYTKRIADMKQVLAVNEGAASRNLIAPMNAMVYDKYWFVWSVPYESFIHSSLRQSGETSILSYDSHPSESLFNKPVEVMLATDKDSIHLMNTAYFDVDVRPFVWVKR